MVGWAGSGTPPFPLPLAGGLHCQLVAVVAATGR